MWEQIAAPFMMEKAQCDQYATWWLSGSPKQQYILRGSKMDLLLQARFPAVMTVSSVLVNVSP